MFQQTAVFFEWPFLPGNPTVRDFAPVGPFHVRQNGTTWDVTDTRDLNAYGLPKRGPKFASREAAEQFITANL